MGWARFDDHYPENAKITEAGPWAELLDVRGIIYCARMETDGLIVRSAIPRISVGIPRTSERIDALVRVGRWRENEGGGWWVHDFLKYNPSRASREKQREQGRERVQKFRGNGVTSAYHSKGSGGESLNPERRVRIVNRCGACGQLDVDCECEKSETA